MVKVICVSGSVGVGKSTYSKKLSKKLKYSYVDLNSFIEENKLKDNYDKKMKTWDVDIKKLNKKLIEFIKNSGDDLVIDGHLSHYLPKKYVSKVIIVKCGLKELRRRLEKRKYKEDKIRENLDCEIFDVCFEEAMELKHKVEVEDN